MGLPEFTVDFKGRERQFDWLEICLISGKIDKHLRICDSYNTECAAKTIKSIKLGNISDACSATNMMKFDISNDTQKHMLWKQYVAWHCNGYGAAPISDYINNLIFQELLLEPDYFANKSVKKVYIALQNSLRHTTKL